MKVIDRPLEALALLELQVFHDQRGFFVESFREEWMQSLGVKESYPQENHSRSKPGVLRGLHFQSNPPQGKIVSVKRGRIWDVAVDVRPHSPTFGQHFATELSDSNGRILWVPPGFAHGFCVLGEEPADVCYKVTAYYNAEADRGVRWNDPALGIDWPLADPLLSERDRNLPDLKSLVL